ncbi:unnamed protein product [Cuscuta campestris]|uniref:Uncharacterized protein n=1 Tax=Cuscuta campestris TaxID=132261 RepID=A0A484KW33_9ASTE|nr:unnamed protein product [Cuscuta campestris]
MQIGDLLVQKDLDVVLGDKPEKMSDADWASLDRKAMSVIRLSLTNNVAFNILKEKTAKGITEALSIMYEKPSAANKVFLIRELVNTSMKNDTSVTEHINNWSGTVTAVTSSVGPDKFTFEKIRDLVLGEDVRRRSSGESSEESLNIVRCRRNNRGSGCKNRRRSQSKTRDSSGVTFWKCNELDEQGHEVKFRDGQWKVVKGNLVIARGKKRGSLYMIELPYEGVTVQVQKRNKVRFIESRGQNKVIYAREKPRATGQIRMNERGKVQGGQSEVFMAVGAQESLQPSFIEDIGSGEPATLTIPYALVSIFTNKAGAGQGLSVGILNLSFVIPQV